MTRSRASSTAKVLLAGLLAAAPASATTWVVDDNGGAGVDFVDIQAAVDAAVDGDVIEVRDGAYPGFTIDGKSLVVVSTADAGAGESVRVAAVVLVTNLAGADEVELDGLRIGFPASRPTGTTLELVQNAGSVRIVDCVVLGNGSDAGLYPRAAVSADASDRVTFLRCVVEGGDPHCNYTDCVYDGGPGIQAAEQSHVTILDCTVSGGDGDFSFEVNGGNGGNGVQVLNGSTLFVHRSTLIAGSGGFGGCSIFCGGNPCGHPGGRTCADGYDGNALSIDASSTGMWKESTIGPVAGQGIWLEVAIAPYCLGTFEECPCGNNGAGTAGCEHSFGLGGARLEGVGNASVAADTVTLQITGLNPNAAPTALFFQGTTGNEGTPFNDGLLCAGGTILRMKGKAASNGMVSFGFGQAGDPAVSAAGQVPPAGATRFYQVWYRNNNASYCTPLRFNMSNGVEIAWTP